MAVNMAQQEYRNNNATLQLLDIYRYRLWDHLGFQSQNIPLGN